MSDPTFDVAEGSITSLIGPNGAGKTAVFNLASGFIRADRGEISFAGRRIERLSGDRIARAGLVRIFQTPRVLTRMTVLENMMLAAKDQPGERLWSAWLTPRRVARKEAEVRDKAEQRLALIRLSHLTHEYAGALSGGQRKLLELGRALMVEPRMILLDEPMAGVAPVLREQLLDHIRELRAGQGVTVCVIEHDMDVVMSISDRIIVMNEGTVIADGPPDAIQDASAPVARQGRLARLPRRLARAARRNPAGRTWRCPLASCQGRRMKAGPASRRPALRVWSRRSPRFSCSSTSMDGLGTAPGE